MAKKYYDGSNSMLNTNTSAMANLPQEVVIKPYPKSSGYMNPNLNDGLSGVDKQIGKDSSKRSGQLQPDKY